jgi:FKBP-type peptidyl-prolyl cis-trans isomerase (trigger factor)
MIKTEITPLDKSLLKIAVVIPEEDLTPFRDQAIKHLNEHTEIAGFRPGHIPADVLEKKVGEDKLFQEMAHEAVNHFYPEIIQNNKINPLGRPEIIITKLAKGNPLEFSITTAVMPEITLPDYKKIAEEVKAETPEATGPTPEEINSVLEELRKSRAVKQDLINKDGIEDNKPDSNLVLPDLNDDFAKSVGPFETLDDLKTKIGENLATEKELAAKEKRRLAILEAIGAKIEVSIPELLVNHETHKMLHELEYEIAKMGLKLDDYLKHINKTRDELTTTWHDEALKRVKLGLVTNAIIEAEKITATTEEVDNLTTSLLLGAHQHKEPTQEEMFRLRAYAENSLIHDKVWAILDNK